MLQQIKMLVLGIITLCRRALCCFSRRRKLSHSGSASGAADQLQAVNVIVERGDFSATGASSAGQAGGGRAAGARERDWNSWDDSPRTVEEHIEQYRQRMAQPPTPPKEEPEPDFFSELTPTIKPQMKFYLEDPSASAATSQQSDFSRLQAQDLVPISINADLEDWVDDNAGGWEELDTSQTKQILREKRRELRHQRQPPVRPAPPTVGAQRLTAGQRAA
ncbi:receptor-binding cancer antigen expressed on SiSo cells [Drosophila mauritiana]|uniref:Receptor-binding cancer antigen expressed on SiSo cells n=1 Tax=Drosophila mauritiana TaxID=7226 RepID=A0A6P8LCZ4_DROMA|nr:receptor-binding cancer antigen expressed on SiSo cells [Drosophila mauritiana]